MEIVGTALAEMTMPQISPLAGEPIERADAERLAGVLKALADPARLTRDLHVLDYHLGNRSPEADPHARGVVDGLSLEQTPDALAYVGGGRALGKVVVAVSADDA